MRDIAASRTFVAVHAETTTLPDSVTLVSSRAWWDGWMVLFETRVSRRKAKGRGLGQLLESPRTTVHAFGSPAKGGMSDSARAKCVRFIIGMHDEMVASVKDGYAGT